MRNVWQVTGMYLPKEVSPPEQAFLRAIWDGAWFGPYHDWLLEQGRGWEAAVWLAGWPIPVYSYHSRDVSNHYHLHAWFSSHPRASSRLRIELAATSEALDQHLRYRIHNETEIVLAVRRFRFVNLDKAPPRPFARWTPGGGLELLTVPPEDKS